MKRLIFAVMLVCSLCTWVHAQPPPVPDPRPAQTEAVEKTHWLNTKTGVRHNQKCRWFGSTRAGRPCTPEEGRPCKICGG